VTGSVTCPPKRRHPAGHIKPNEAQCILAKNWLKRRLFPSTDFSLAWSRLDVLLMDHAVGDQMEAITSSLEIVQDEGLQGRTI
jgi:hypothetical protein